MAELIPTAQPQEKETGSRGSAVRRGRHFQLWHGGLVDRAQGRDAAVLESDAGLRERRQAAIVKGDGPHVGERALLEGIAGDPGRFRLGPLHCLHPTRVLGRQVLGGTCVAVNDGFDFGDLSIHDLQAHGEQVGVGDFVVLYQGNKGRDSASHRIGDIVAVFSQGVECHPERLAQPDLGAIFGVAVMGGRGHERGVVFPQGVQVEVHESFQTGLVA